MSSIVLQIGQCGNQIGQHFWSLVDKSFLHSDKNDNCFVLANPVNQQRYYRSINIDTETKVIDNLIGNNASSFKSTFRPSNMITEKCGRGNNWAMGYYQGRLSHRDDIFERTMQEMRREAERGDVYKGCAMFHSISGGTGSGVSSKLSELIRDEYEKELLVSVAVTPFEDGDTPLQDYNSLLALSKLHYHSDVVLLFSNDQLLKKYHLEQKLINRFVPGHNKVPTTTTFNDLNKIIASCLAGLFLPVNINENNKIMLENVAAAFNKDHGNKFACCHSISQQSRTQEECLETLFRQLSTFNKTESIENSEQNFSGIKLDKLIFVNRGTQNKDILSEPMINKKLKELFQLKTRINVASIWQSKEPTNSITMAFQSDFNKFYLEKTFKNCLEKFVVGAYLHWYERYGATADDFHDAFKYIQNILSYM